MVGVVKVTYFLVPNLLALRAFVKNLLYFNFNCVNYSSVVYYVFVIHLESRTFSSTHNLLVGNFVGAAFSQNHVSSFVE